MQAFLKEYLGIILLGLMIVFLPISRASLPVFTVLIICWVIMNHRQDLKQLYESNKVIVIFMGMYLLWVLATLWWSIDKANSWRAPSKVFLPVLLSLAVAVVMLRIKRMNVFISALLVSSGLVAISGLWQKFIGVDFLRQNPMTDGRICSSFRHANDYGAFLIVISLILFMLLPVVWKEWRNIYARVAYVMVVLLNLFCLVFTFSRNSWLGFCLGLVIILLIKRMWKLLGGVMLVGLIAGLFLLTKGGNIFLPHKDAGHTVMNRSLLSDGGRFELWKDAFILLNGTIERRRFMYQYRQDLFELLAKQPQWKAISATEGRLEYVSTDLLKALDRKYPKEKQDVLILLNQTRATNKWLGFGINTYTTAVVRVNKRSGYPHNCFLQMTVELGIIGLLIFLSLWGWWAKSLIFSLRNITDKFWIALGVGVGSAVVGLWWHSFFDTTFYATQLNYLLWILFGLGLAVSNHSKQLTIAKKSL